MASGRLDGASHPVALVARDPDLARRRAEQVLDGDCDPATRSAALRMLGVARRELGEPAAAERLLRQSAAVAARAGDTESAAHARASRLGLLALRGSGGVAAEALVRLSADTSSARATVLTHHGLAAAQRGRFGAALAGFDAALAALDGDTEGDLLPGVLSNRGLALMYAGRLDEAAADLERALAGAAEAGQACLRGVALQNLGCLAVRTGDLARAVSCFGAAERLVPPVRRPSVRMDHADALLAAGMHREAGRALGGLGDLGAAAGLFRGGRATAEAATSGLLRAKVLLAQGDTGAARGLARRLRRAFPADSLWAELAGLVEWSAHHSAAPDRRSAARRFSRPPAARAARRGERGGPGRPGSSARSGDGPRRSGLPEDATSAHRPRAGREDAGSGGGPPPAWAGADCSDTAETATALAHCVHSAPLGPVSAMLPSAREAAALRTLAAGDHRAARGRLGGRAGGLRPVRHLELLVHARAHRREVAAAGARAAIREGDAAAALEWVEFASAPAVPAGPCRDTAWLRLLERYRQAHARARIGEAPIRRELSALADALAGAQWHAACMAADGTGAADPGDTGLPAAHALEERLAGRAFVRYARVHGADAAITVVDGRTRLHPLPSAGAVEDAAAKLAYAARVRVLAEGRRGRAARDGVAPAAERVERLLLAPVAEAVGDRPLIVVPSPAAQALPWGMLPSLRGREVSVVPSGSAWLARCGGDADEHLGGRSAAVPRALLAAGGAPEGAVGEVRALAPVYPVAEALRGPAVRVGAVLRGLEHADVAHLAAHGSVSAQSPMLSAIQLEDGPLFAYDVERLSRAPRVTVLSSCWVGGSAPACSGAPLGMAAALLAMGGRVVVAGVLPVSDHGIGPAMLAFHAALRAGVAPARAVADHLAGAGFVCYGAG
ncbi:CHAT domain-containing protein [Streptomonospora wellingtoniae]|uniref:CHAT domain-containing protein n=1 Tax=Streptomonospora wellingtoniae TaxID=3075544 RepID=A0ABU2KWS2_9ACTN|nr:CHAT domain-containing protein [Streptomonospora sp. DSM 45055]MDT0303671.1 CHAT domain-containing protein [Streptomonospora sp. DSM 45055]